MNKIHKRNFRGIEYISIAELPEELREEIGNWLSDEVLIKIKTEEGIQRNCIQLKDFMHWYENLYTSVSHQESTDRKQTRQSHGKLTLSLEG